MNWDVLFPDLSHRANIAELMDDPACSEECLLKTVRSFTLLNRLVSRYRSVLNRWILRDMLKHPERRYRVADLGAGGCDIPAWLLGRAGKLGLDLSVLAVESNPVIVEHARRVYHDVSGLQILCRDATNLQALGEVDYVIGNHFLHHFKDNDIGELLTRVMGMPIRRFVFTDLRRSFPAYVLHSLLAALLFPGTFVGTDGRRSIRRGFRPQELAALCAEAGLADRIQLHTLTPARLVIVGSASRTAPHAE